MRDSLSPWSPDDADEARRMIWQQMNPRWHFTPPWYSRDGNWHASCGRYDAAADTLGRLMDVLVVGEALDAEPLDGGQLPDLERVILPGRPHPFTVAHRHGVSH